MAGLLESFIAGGQAGAQARGIREARQDEQEFRGLTPGLIAGDPAAFERAVALDPKRAMAAQGAGDDQLRRLKGALTYVDSISKQYENEPDKQSQALESAYQSSIKPYLARYAPPGTPLPATFAESLPKLQEARARIAQLDAVNSGDAPTGFREIDMKLRAAGYQPGSAEYQEGMRIATGQQGRAATGGFGFEMVKGPDGMVRPQRTNPRTGAVEIYDERTGDFTPIGGGAALNGGAPAPMAAPLPSNVQVEAGLSPEQMEAVRMDIANNGQSDAYTLPPRPAGNQLQNTQPVVAPNRLAVGRAPEQEAAAIEAAKTNVQLQNLPTELGMRTNAAVDQAVRIDEGKNAAEKAAAAPATIATLQNSIDSIDALLKSPDLDSIVGIGSLNPLNKIPGTQARGLIARADQIAGQAFLAAFNQLKGGGAITEREGAAATAAMARLDRSQGIEDYKSALNDLKAAIAPAIQRAKQQQGRGSRPAPTSGWSIQRVE